MHLESAVSGYCAFLIQYSIECFLAAYKLLRLHITDVVLDIGSQGSGEVLQEPYFMIQIEILEQHIVQLDDNAFAKLREWFIEFDQVRWDKKIEADSNAGKLDFLINAAIDEHQVR